MKVKLKSAFWQNGKVFKKGDIVEVETAAFRPYLMTEIPEVKTIKVPVEEKPKAKKRSK